jgi:two-component system chemotaxis sensor kinase CheA
MGSEGDKADSVRDEFLSEAQEIIEALSRDLLLLDHGQKEGGSDPDLINEVFRGVHTLKGLAGMFGYAQLSALAHALENLLDDLRLGRVTLSQEVLDVLFEGVENFQRLLGEAKNPGERADVDLLRYAESLERLSAPEVAAKPSLDQYEIDPGVLAVLTEYEEHRLRTNIEQGVAVYRLKVRFSLAAIDSALEDLKARAKPVAELITYLPSMGAGDSEDIELDVLLASRATLADLTATLATEGATLAPVPRRAASVTSAPPPGAAAVLPPLPRPAPVPGTVSRPEARGDVPARGASGVPSMPADRPSPSKHANPEADGLAPREREGLTGAGIDALTLRSVASTVRVDIRKLDHLMNVVGELAIVRSAVSRISERLRKQPELRQVATELHRLHRSFERHLEDLQEGILGVRMVPLGQVFEKLGRVIRQVARDHSKEMRLVVTGAETEVDKLIVEELSDPLMHLIRNAIDHGIEVAKVRELAGKPKAGTLALNAYQKGNHVLIEVADDGAGMDQQKLLDTGVRRGLITAEQAKEMSRAEALNLIFLPGFSTSSEVTDLSGRGVGMDVVKTNITRLGGVVDVTSEHGIGTKFTITLPITLAIISALIVRVAARTYAISLSSVQEALLFDPNTVRTVEGREMLTLRGATLPLCRLAAHFGHTSSEPVGRRYVVVSQIGQRRVGFVVDHLLGQQDIVIKALGPSLRDVPGFAGATDLGEQQVALVLDAGTLMDEVLLGTNARGERMGAAS